MRRDIELMLSLINEGKLFIEEFSKRPLLNEDLEYTTGQYRPATIRDIKHFANSKVWQEMLSNGRAFFAVKSVPSDEGGW